MGYDKDVIDKAVEENRENSTKVSGNIEKDKEDIANKIEQLESKIEELKMALEISTMGSSDRNGKNNIFEDVFTNIIYYSNPGNISTEDAGKLANKISIVLTVITNIGMVLAVLMSAFMGVKYMLGSVEEKADYKKDMVPYLIGAILLFGICSIVKILQGLGSSINNL